MPRQKYKDTQIKLKRKLRAIIKCIPVIALIILIVGLALGYWIGNQLKNVDKSKAACTSQKPIMSHEEIVDEIDRKNIERHLR